MNKTDVLKSVALKKKFCEDYKIPITVFEEPCFYQRLRTLDVLFDCIEKFNQFCDDLKYFICEENYFEHCEWVNEQLYKQTRNCSSYVDFMEQDFEYRFKNLVSNYGADVLKLKDKKLYDGLNDGGTYVSIKIKKDNFDILRHYKNDFFGDFDSKEGFMSKFTCSKCVIENSYIDGANDYFLSKQLSQYKLYLITLLYLHIKDTFIDKEVKFYSLNENEVIIKVDECLKFSLNELKNAVKKCPSGIGELCEVEMFDINKTGDYGWSKVIYGKDEDKVEFIGVNPEIFHQVVKHYYEIPIVENDLVFEYNGKLAKYLKPIDNPWKN